MSIESRPPQEAEQQNTAEMIAPTANPHPADQAPASISPTGQPGGRRKMGKTGPPGPAMKGRSAAKRKPEKKLPASQKKAATKKTAAKKAGAGGRFKPMAAAKDSWKAVTKRTSGSKPTAAQKKTPPKKAAQKKMAGARKAGAAAKKTGAKRATRR